MSPQAAAVAALQAIDPNADLAKVGPGFAGFVAVFAIALATLLLVLSMVRHLRKVRYSPDPAALDATADPARRDATEPGTSTTDENA